MIEAFYEDGRARAIALLQAGFPDHGEAFWREGLAGVCPKAQGAIPAGWFLVRGGQDAGILLGFANTRHSGRAPVVNLSSWFVAPAHRLAAPAMLRAVLKQPCRFTDLTPSSNVEAMLPLLGFRLTVEQWGLACLPVLAFGRQKPAARISVFTPSDAPALDAAMALALIDHQNMGHLCLLLHAQGEITPMIFARGQNRLGLASATIILSPVASILERHMGALSRLLLKRGIFWLEMEYAPGETARVPLLKTRRQPRYVRPAPDEAEPEPALDYTYSELAYLSPPMSARRKPVSFIKKAVAAAASFFIVAEFVSWAI